MIPDPKMFFVYIVWINKKKKQELDNPVTLSDNLSIVKKFSFKAVEESSGSSTSASQAENLLFYVGVSRWEKGRSWSAWTSRAA